MNDLSLIGQTTQEVERDFTHNLILSVENNYLLTEIVVFFFLAVYGIHM